MIHLYNHWVCITNYNPWLFPENPTGIWHLYDSLQAPESYVHLLSNVIRRFTDGAHCNINYVIMPKQSGTSDCGLFALGYATALCLEINPATLIFDQSRMRQEFNQMVMGHEVHLFSHELSSITPQCLSYSIDHFGPNDA